MDQAFHHSQLTMHFINSPQKGLKRKIYFDGFVKILLECLMF